MEYQKRRSFIENAVTFFKDPLSLNECVYGNLKVSSENHEPKFGDPSEQLFLKLHP